MRHSAYVAYSSWLLRLLLLPIIVLAFFSLSLTNVHAQTTEFPTPTLAGLVNDFRNPDVDPNVPRNTHSLAQIVTIDVLSAIICQLSGIDPINPQQPCIDLNPLTGKLGVPQNENEQFGQNNQPQVGGALGFVAHSIGSLYQNPVSSKTYFDYVGSKFGIVEPAYAQIPNCTVIDNNFGYGYCGLNPIFNVWKFSRDFSFSGVVIAAVFLGLGIMLRFKVDPRTVMTLQNQIPRIFIAMIFIAFSYAIAGGMVDIMWTVTYMGVNTLTESTTSQACNIDGKPAPLKEIAPVYLLQTPLGYVDNIFAKDCGILGKSGIATMAGGTGAAIGYTLADLIFQFVGMDYRADQEGCGLTNPASCARYAFGWLIKIIISLIVLVTLLITLVRLWFQLLKTTVLFIIYTIAGPIYIAAGLLPGRPLGLEKWVRLEFAHLAPFPVVAGDLVFAKILIDSYPSTKFTPDSVFVPPLIGNPNMDGFGILLAFGLILIAPGIPDIIKEKMKVPPGKLGGRVQGGIAAGAAVTGGAAGAGWKRMTRRFDPETGKEAGALRQLAYGRILGMKKGFGKKAEDVDVSKPTRRYRLARRFLGGSLGVSQDTPKRH